MQHILQKYTLHTCCESAQSAPPPPPPHTFTSTSQNNQMNIVHGMLAIIYCQKLFYNFTYLIFNNETLF
jgi:hypothetical protein